MRLLRQFLTAAAGFALISSAPVEGRAEGLFEFLFGPEPGQQAAPQHAPSAPNRRARERGGEAVGELRFARPRDGAGGGAGGFATEPAAGGYCVRTCDGYFFPLIKSTHATRLQSCEFACPSAQMDIYDGASIETARNRKGQRYTALPHAFAFRDKPGGACACNDPNKSQAYFEKAARNDPTLQSGDIVVESEGALVYSGSKLVPLNSAAFMSSTLKNRLRAMLRRNQEGRWPVTETVSRAPPVASEIIRNDQTGSTLVREISR